MVTKPDLENRLRRADPVPENLYDEASPVLFASILERRDEMTRTDVPIPTRHPTPTPRRSMAWVFAAALAIVVVAIGVVAILVAAPDDDAAEQMVEPPAWTRVVLEPGFHARELTVTSFGLVAAAQTDGIWITEDGVNWRQAFAGPYEPYGGTTTTPAPPLTVPPPMPDVWSSVYGVGEFEGKLYAFGGVVLDGSATSRDIVWSSEDGVTWSQTVLRESSPAQDGLFLSLVVATDDMIAAYEEFGSRILYSTDGTEWTLLDGAATGLEGVGLTDVVYHDGEFFALGESYPNGKSNSRGIRALYTSADGLHFEKTAGPDFTENQLPDSLVGYNGRLFAAGVQFDPVRADAVAAVWHSADGIEWEQMAIPPSPQPGMSSAAPPIPAENGLVIVVNNRHYEAGDTLSVFLTDDGSTVEPVSAPTGTLDGVSDDLAATFFDGRLILIGEHSCSLECDPDLPIYQLTWTP